jgi:hypothetical protein
VQREEKFEFEPVQASNDLIFLGGCKSHFALIAQALIKPFDLDAMR